MYMYIYVNIMRGKTGRNYISRQACFFFIYMYVYTVQNN